MSTILDHGNDSDTLTFWGLECSQVNGRVTQATSGRLMPTVANINPLAPITGPQHRLAEPYCFKEMQPHGSPSGWRVSQPPGSLRPCRLAMVISAGRYLTLASMSFWRSGLEFRMNCTIPSC